MVPRSYPDKGIVNTDEGVSKLDKVVNYKFRPRHKIMVLTAEPA